MFDSLKISIQTNFDVVTGSKPIIKGKLFDDDEKNKVFVNLDKFSQELEEEFFSGKK
jgi:hypothetical protein